MKQWVLKITEYADRLLEDLDTLYQVPDTNLLQLHLHMRVLYYKAE
jgi:leucyl-tRNA synthetase